MTRLAHLWLRMLRLRVAVMIWMFMLLAVAFHGGLATLSLDALWGTVLLSASYVAATSVNDLADREIDRINHPGDRARPLVSGDADPSDLVRVNALGAVVAFAAAVPLGVPAIAIAGASLAIGYGYSLSPLRLSFRTYLAPLLLAVAYVLVPYAVGLIVAGARPGGRDALFAAGLAILFVARITLKDFRDREGDATYGKPTLLLRFGKGVTCLVSLIALATGDALLLVALRPPVALALALQIFVAVIVGMLRMLWRTDHPRTEQVAIGLGARMGNGLLIGVLAWLALEADAAPSSIGLMLVAGLAVLYGANVLALAARPQEALIGYKG